jgi:hypothetical protein
MAGATPGFGPSVLTWRDVAAWADLTRERPDPWEARALVELSARRAAISSEQNAESHGGHSKA